VLKSCHELVAARFESSHIFSLEAGDGDQAHDRLLLFDEHRLRSAAS